MPKIIDRQAFLNAVQDKFGDIKVVSRQQILEICEEYNVDRPRWLTKNEANRVGRGMYSLDGSSAPAPKATKPESKKVKLAPIAAIKSEVPVVDRAVQVEMALALAHTNDRPAAAVSLIPDKASGYVPFGHFADVRAIVKSGRFYPLYITGLSGNGKTMMVEQVCATEKRECIRTNITIETDESDLLGGFNLRSENIITVSMNDAMKKKFDSWQRFNKVY
jgi:hypothetical protein